MTEARRCPKCGAILERTHDYVGGRGYVDGWACSNRHNIDHWCGYGVLDQ